MSLDEDAASAGGIDARVVADPGQRQDAEAGAKALLGMRPGRDDRLEKSAAAKGRSSRRPRPALASTCRSGDGRSCECPTTGRRTSAPRSKRRGHEAVLYAFEPVAWLAISAVAGATFISPSRAPM